MKTLVAGCVAVAAGVAAYFVFTGPSSGETVVSLLQEAMGENAQVSLEDCDLQIVQTTATEAGATQARVRADLRMYEFETVRMTQAETHVTYQASRVAVTNAMMDQANAVFAGATPEVQAALLSGDALRAMLNEPEARLFARVMAEVVTGADGAMTIVAHEDAPELFDLAQQVFTLEAPASYSVSVSYSGDVFTRDSVLMGEVAAVPPLMIRFENEIAAQEFGRAMYAHASVNCPGA